MFNCINFKNIIKIINFRYISIIDLYLKTKNNTSLINSVLLKLSFRIKRLNYFIKIENIYAYI